MVNGQSAQASRTVSALAAVVTVLFAAGVRSDVKEPSELQRRTGEYVRQFNLSLANLVGQEDMQVRDRKVTSDILLVRYPGSLTDLLFYRDVRSVNGTDRPDHPEHLLDMFQKNFDSAIGRANQISTDGAEYVPPILNPLFAIAFLQPHYQARFKIDERGADLQWPRRTKVLAFQETTKPTILRAGMMREFDVLTRGSAWVEESTGRVLQTELQIRHADGVTTIKTTFKMDDRLQVMVPASMQTTKPEGRATYSNFRRFIVEIDEAIESGFR